jgi:DNA-binding NarL/FixJ family response regulator
MNFLIVDDHEVVRRGVRELLGREYPAAHLTEAGDSAGATAQLVDPSWDLILLDINIPGRGGFDVLAEAKRLCPKTPVVVFTMYPEAEFAVRAFQLGAAAYVNKASGGDELLAAIRKVLAGGKYITSLLAEKLIARLTGAESSSPHEVLSSRELQVLRSVALGKSLKEIAAELSLSEKTIATYRMRLAKKLALNSSVEITRYALKHRLVE